MQEMIFYRRSLLLALFALPPEREVGSTQTLFLTEVNQCSNNFYSHPSPELY